MWTGIRQGPACRKYPNPHPSSSYQFWDVDDTTRTGLIFVFQASSNNNAGENGVSVGGLLLTAEPSWDCRCEYALQHEKKTTWELLDLFFRVSGGANPGSWEGWSLQGDSDQQYPTRFETRSTFLVMTTTGGYSTVYTSPSFVEVFGRIVGSCISLGEFGVGGALEQAEQYDGALACYEKALLARGCYLGEDHIDVAKLLFDVARVMEYQGNTEGSRDLYHAAHAMYSKHMMRVWPKCKTIMKSSMIEIL